MFYPQPPCQPFCLGILFFFNIMSDQCQVWLVLSPSMFPVFTLKGLLLINTLCNGCSSDHTSVISVRPLIIKEEVDRRMEGLFAPDVASLLVVSFPPWVSHHSLFLSLPLLHTHTRISLTCSLIRPHTQTATTRFLECSKCRHFFLYTPGHEQSFSKRDAHTSASNMAAHSPEHKDLPTPKEVSRLEHSIPHH